MSKIKVTQIRSVIGHPQEQRRIVQALGLRRINHTVLHQDNPAIRGMIQKVPHLVKMEEINDA